MSSPLHSVDARPGWHQCQNSGHQVNKITGRVAFVAAGLPQLVQTCAADHQRRVQLQPIRPECGILEKLLRETHTRATLLSALHFVETIIHRATVLSRRRAKYQNVETNRDTQAYQML